MELTPGILILECSICLDQAFESSKPFHLSQIFRFLCPSPRGGRSSARLVCRAWAQGVQKVCKAMSNSLYEKPIYAVAFFHACYYCCARSRFLSVATKQALW